MAQYDLPNGKKLTLPDNLSPEDRAKAAEYIKQDFGIDINQSTFLESASEKLNQ